MSFERFGEQAPALQPADDQGFSVAEEAPSGIRRKKLEPDQLPPPPSLPAHAGYDVESFSHLDRLMYFSGVDDLQREAAGFPSTPEGREAWEKQKKKSGREVGENLTRIRDEEELRESRIQEEVKVGELKRIRHTESAARRRALLEGKRRERDEHREASWRKENHRVFRSLQLLDEQYADLFKDSEFEGTGDIRELYLVQAKIEGESSLDRAGLRCFRRSEGVVYQEDGDALWLAGEGKTEDMVDADKQLFHKEGLRLLLSGEYRPIFEAFLRKKYALDLAGLARVRAQVEGLYKQQLGVQTGEKEKRAIDAKTQELVERFSEEIVARFASGETDGHLGKEACSRERFQWLQNRLLGVLRATGVLRHVDFSAGALALGSEGSDLVYAELDSEDKASNAQKATLFSRLALRDPQDWGKEFPPRVRKSARFEEHVQASVAELGLLGVLMQDVGGDVSAYDVDLERGRFTQKTTGEVFSVGADFVGNLPPGLAAKMDHLPELRAVVEEAVAYRNVPFEIACMHRLPVPEKTRTALQALSLQLQDDAHPVARFVRQSFARVFLNPLLAEKEYTLFADRVAACASLSVFDDQHPGIVADFTHSLQPLVGSASILHEVPDGAALLDAAA